MIVEDLTTGPISGHFRRLAIPAAIGMLFSTLYNVVDTFYAGFFGTEAQAGLTVGYQAFSILIAFGVGIGVAMSSLVGNAKGRADVADARRLSAQGISFALIATGFLMLLAILTGPTLLTLVSEPGAYRDAGLAYLKWLVFSLPGFTMAYSTNGILQARGDTVSMQRALVVAFFANVALNPMLMFGIPNVIPGMGLNGIALATVLSQTGVAVFLLYRTFGRAMMQGLAWQEFVPIPKKYLEIAGQSIPASFALLITFASGFIVLYALKGFSEESVAAYGISLRVEQIFLLPAIGITVALTPIAAQNFGAGNHDRVREAFAQCWKMGVAGTIIAFPFLWFGGGIATSFFTSDPKVIEIGALFLKVEAVVLPIYVVLFSVNSLLQALKKAVWTLWIGVYRQGIGIAFFIWLFTSVFEFGLSGVRVGIAAAVVTGLMLSLAIAIRVARERIGGLTAPKTA